MLRCSGSGSSVQGAWVHGWFIRFTRASRTSWGTPFRKHVSFAPCDCWRNTGFRHLRRAVSEMVLYGTVRRPPNRVQPTSLRAGLRDSCVHPRLDFSLHPGDRARTEPHWLRKPAGRDPVVDGRTAQTGHLFDLRQSQKHCASIKLVLPPVSSKISSTSAYAQCRMRVEMRAGPAWCEVPRAILEQQADTASAWPHKGVPV